MTQQVLCIGTLIVDIINEATGEIYVEAGEELTEESLAKLYDEELKKAKELDDNLVKEQTLLSDLRRTEETYNAILDRLTELSQCSLMFDKSAVYRVRAHFPLQCPVIVLQAACNMRLL